MILPPLVFPALTNWAPFLSHGENEYDPRSLKNNVSIGRSSSVLRRHQLPVGRQQRGQGGRQAWDIPGHPGGTRMGHRGRGADEAGECL